MAVREVQTRGRAVPEHSHDWPSLILPLLGGFTGRYENETAWIEGPSALLHPAGGAHAASVGNWGLEAITLLIDPAWLRLGGFEGRLDRHYCWTGGKAGFAARRLIQAWTRAPLPETELATATARFLTLALHSKRRSDPEWLQRVRSGLRASPAPATRKLARELNLHPAWIAQAYRASTGEGLQETVRRHRVERAAYLLRCSDQPLAGIAVQAGFCDQSHMNRSFRAVVGRTPLEVRAEKLSA